MTDILEALEALIAAAERAGLDDVLHPDHFVLVEARQVRARYDLLHADAAARQRGATLDDTPRRETVPS